MSNWKAPLFNNAAGRMYVLLEKIKSANGSEAAHVAWQRILFDARMPGEHIDKIGMHGVAVALAGLNQQVTEIAEEIIEKEAEHHSMYLAQFPALREVFSPRNLGANFGQHQAPITGELQANLLHCARIMESEKEVEEIKLKEVYDAATELFELIENTKMPRGLRKALLTLVERVRQALATYRINGTTGLQDALDGLVGGMILRKPSIDDVPESSHMWQLIETVWTKTSGVLRTASGVNALVDLSFKTPLILEAINRLPGLPQG